MIIRSRDRKLASRASGSLSLNRRIRDMENRLMVERAQVVAHSREFGGNVRRRLTSPTSLVFAGSMGFIASEILASRPPRRRGGKSRLLSAGKSAGRTLLGSLAKPLLSMVHLASIAFMAKEGKEASDAAQAAAGQSPPPTLH